MSLTDKERVEVASTIDLSSLGELAELATERIRAVLADPTLPGTKETIELVRLLLNKPKPKQALQPIGQPAPVRRTFTVVAAK